MRIRSIFLGLCLLATAAFAAPGEYQKTRDSRTTVWNGSPKPGESASWAGARDKEGYATGFGTITWYNANGTVYAVYYGNMVNGKLEGPVNAHMGSRTAHSYFADGTRVTAWARGPAPSKMNVPEALVAKRRNAESEQPKPREERVQAKKETTEKPAQSSEVVRPIEQPQKATVAATKPKPKPTATPAEPVRTEPPATEPSPESTASPPAVAEETRTVSTPEPTQSASSFSEPPRIAQMQETPRSLANDTPPVSTPEPSVEQKPEAPQESPTPEKAKKSGSEGSLSELTGPPSSLRGGSIPESSAPPRSEKKSKSSGTRGVAELSEDEAIGLADTEARSRGYDLTGYQRPKADYSAVKDKWSFFYTLKDPKSAGGDLQPFSVTVEDKTKKVEIRKNY